MSDSYRVNEVWCTEPNLSDVKCYIKREATATGYTWYEGDFPDALKIKAEGLDAQDYPRDYDGAPPNVEYIAKGTVYAMLNDGRVYECYKCQSVVYVKPSDGSRHKVFGTATLRVYTAYAHMSYTKYIYVIPYRSFRVDGKLSCPIDRDIWVNVMHYRGGYSIMSFTIKAGSTSGSCNCNGLWENPIHGTPTAYVWNGDKWQELNYYDQDTGGHLNSMTLNVPYSFLQVKEGDASL